MAISDDLFRAILSMDAYDRGYNAAIGNGPDGLGGIGSRLGNATVISRDNGDTAQAASFFAQAYSWNGNTVISYRGTDGLLLDGVPSDIPHWSVWVGNNYQDAQVLLAAQFYQQTRAAIPGAVIETVGHSLGGALGGFVAGIYGLKATLFDDIGYMGAAQNLYTRATTGLATYDPVNPLLVQVDEAARSDFYAPIYGTNLPAAPNFNRVSGYWVDGEVATLTRSSAESNLLSKLQIGTAIQQPHPVDFHNQAFIVEMMFGNQLSDTSWLRAGKELVAALFDDRVGQAAGASRLSGRYIADGSFALALQTAMAYSAIDDGTRVFGDTGIRALFDDANDLGKALDLTNASNTLKNSAAAISNMLTQFAGQLAVGKILQEDHANALNGVLSLSTDQQTLAVDFSDQLWSLGTPTGAPTTDIIGRSDLIDQAFATYSGGAAG
jgi:hypothetical protein